VNFFFIASFHRHLDGGLEDGPTWWNWFAH
jgi:hypothetical protein